jgi:hypothetical protein
MKKLLTITLLFACSLTGTAQTFFTVDNVRYLLEDDHAVVARQDRELTGDINIPSTVTYGGAPYNVTRLLSPDDGESGGGGAFQECGITSITLPESITEVPAYTFYQCKQLCSAILYGPVTRIGKYAFGDCETLTTFDYIPDDVTEIGQGAFQWTGLTQFEIPAGVELLEWNVLEGTKINYLEIPASVKRIYGSALNMNKTDEQGQPLKITVKMFQRDCRLIEEIDNRAFGDMTAIDLQVPAGGKVVYQEYWPWMFMNSITEYGEDTGEPLVPDRRHITIDDVRYMLKDGEAHVDIQHKTLNGEIAIPKKITYKEVDYPVTTVIDRYDFDLTPFSETQVTKVTLPSSIKKIGVGAFSKSQYLQEVVLNEGITEIGEGAFFECHELTTINIPSTVSVIHKSIFYECNNLQTLTLPDGITSLEFEALYNSGIETLTIPSSCTLFASCSLYLPNLKTLIMKVKEPSDIINTGEYHTETMNVSVFADYFLPNYEVVREFLSNVDLIVPLGCAESYKMQDPWYNFRSITEEGSDYYQPKNISVNIDGINYVLKETVNEENEIVRTATIGQQNPNLLSGDIVIPEKVSYAKKVLQGDEWVTLEAQDYDVTDIFTSIIDFNGDDRGYSSGAGAFQECPITSICLPATITTIPTKTFYGCQQLKSVTLPEGITTIRAGAFANCSSLEEIYLPETITYMEGSYIFRNCTSLKKVNIPKKITSLSDECFRNCGIETFIIPKNITSIGWACFGEFETSVKSIKICHESYSEGSISFPENMFSVLDVSGITLIVPEGTKESLYSQIYPWKNFNIVEYSDQNDVHQYNNYRVEFEEETPSASRRRVNRANSEDLVTVGFTPSGVAMELPTEIEKDGKKYLVQFKNIPTVMPAKDIVLQGVLTPKGDTNGDGYLSVSDVVELVNAVMNPSSISDITKYDMDGDGYLTVTDVVLLVNLVMSN